MTEAVLWCVWYNYREECSDWSCPLVCLI